MNNSWFQGNTEVLTYAIEELLATKLHALYQRKKGRDLYDFWYAVKHIPQLDINRIIHVFNHYMKNDSIKVSRAEFEKNLFLKQQAPVFNNDIRPLLSSKQRDEYKSELAYQILFQDFLTKLEGEPWKSL